MTCYYAVTDLITKFIASYIMTIMTLYKNPYSYRYCSGRSDVVSCWHHCNSCNYCIPSTKATPQESRDPTRYSCFVHMYFLASPLIIESVDSISRDGPDMPYM